MSDNPICWSPPRERVEASSMYRFMQEQGFSDYDALHRWSLDNPAEYWEAHRKFCDIEFSEPAKSVLEQPGDMTTAKWFTGARLSFPEHLLRHNGDRTAIIFRGENGARRELNFDELRDEVAAFAAGLRNAGIGKGDRVVGFLPNCPEAIIAMLAATSIGAIWSSCSPDFGVNGVVDRFGQIQPRILICADGYFYNGKQFDSLEVVSGVVSKIEGIERIIVVPFTCEQCRLVETRQCNSLV